MARASLIDRIQAAMIERLTAGLGKMVKIVQPYGGELDDGLATCPAVSCRLGFVSWGARNQVP